MLVRLCGPNSFGPARQYSKSWFKERDLDDDDDDDSHELKLSSQLAA